MNTVKHKQGALILAAGKGTRMYSAKPKVMQTLLGESMLTHVHRALQPLFSENMWAVIGYGAEVIRKAFERSPLLFVEQTVQNGTGHAVQCAMEALQTAKIETLLVVNGDTPLVTTELIEHFLTQAGSASAAFATLTLEDPASFGRVVRKHGKVHAIVEAKDYDEGLYGEPSGEINAGLYHFSMDFLQKHLHKLTTENANGEMYLTDLIALGIAAGDSVEAIVCGRERSLLGVNTPLELAWSEKHLQESTMRRHLERGVIMHSPELVRIGAGVELEPGVELFGPCELYGTTTLRQGALVRSHCVIIDSHIEGAEIREFCHIEQARVGKKAIVGPYARLRPAATIEENAHVGNFVEIKNATLGPSAKANHLSYVGDAQVGAEVNIGAGVITCNYDGANKHLTTIGKGAFIGSNASLVAPVTIGENATIGAGSAISKNVPAENLAVTRAEQRMLPWRKKTKK